MEKKMTIRDMEHSLKSIAVIQLKDEFAGDGLESFWDVLMAETSIDNYSESEKLDLAVHFNAIVRIIYNNKVD
jgi:hypothetical protein